MEGHCNLKEMFVISIQMHEGQLKSVAEIIDRGGGKLFFGWRKAVSICRLRRHRYPHR
jgi:hypothetical protein